MTLNPYLSFSGQCEAAFKLYERALGGKVLMINRYGESPMGGQTPPNWSDKIMHMRMAVGDTVLMGSDGPPDQYQAPQGIQVSVGVEDPDEAERAFALLAEGGKVSMPMQETFWAKRFGMLVDQFGTPWMINCEKPMTGANA